VRACAVIGSGVRAVGALGDLANPGVWESGAVPGHGTVDQADFHLGSSGDLRHQRPESDNIDWPQAASPDRCCHRCAYLPNYALLEA
jgi:hypothetical protein